MEGASAEPPFQIEPRRPGPDRRLDLYLALAVTAVAAAAYVASLAWRGHPPHGLAVVFFAAAPISAGFALVVLLVRARTERDPALRWFCAGLVVAWVAMVLQLISFPAVAADGGFFGTDDQSSSALYLWFHLALALGVAAGALKAPVFWRIPYAVGGVVLSLLFAIDAVPLPKMLRSDATFTGLLVGLEYLLAGVVALAALLWVLRVGRAAPALRGWVGVALSLSVYDVLFNALGGERFTAVWWASLSMRAATYAVLAVGVMVSILVQLRDLETYSHAELERREGQLRTSLRLTSQLLSSAEDLARAVTSAEVADALCAHAVATSGLRRASLLVARRGQGFTLLGSAGYDDDMRAAVRHIGWDTPHPAPRTLLKGSPVFVTGAEKIRAQFPGVVRTALREAATAAALPIRVGDEPVGTLVVWDSEPRPWDRLQRDVLTGLTIQGGQALRRAQAYEEEANAAATLQRSLLPPSLPHHDHITMAARYVSGERGLKVGGDWYDCVEISDRQVALVVGDVMGKGLRAAALMGQIRTSLRSLAIADPSPAAVLNGMDRLAETLDPDEIATVVYVLLDVDQSVARVARAGHLPPILVDPEGHATLLEGGGSPPLGSPVSERLEDEVAVASGSTFVLYTDGIVEDRVTGLDRLPEFIQTVERVVAAHGQDIDQVAKELLAQTSDPQREDDIALLLARFTATESDRPAQASAGSPGGSERPTHHDARR